MDRGPEPRGAAGLPEAHRGSSSPAAAPRAGRGGARPCSRRGARSPRVLARRSWRPSGACPRRRAPARPAARRRACSGACSSGLAARPSCSACRTRSRPTSRAGRLRRARARGAAPCRGPRPGGPRRGPAAPAVRRGARAARGLSDLPCSPDGLGPVGSRRRSHAARRVPSRSDPGVLLLGALGLGGPWTAPDRRAGEERPVRRGPTRSTTRSRSAGLTRADLGWQRSRLVGRLPPAHPDKLRHVDDLFEQPLATVPLLRGAGRRGARAARARKVARRRVQQGGGAALPRCVTRPGRQTGAIGAMRSYSANLTAEPISARRRRCARVYRDARRPTRFVTFGKRRH